MADYKEGDTVQLKSGGPKMTIVKAPQFTAGGTYETKCAYFHEGELKQIHLHPDALQPVF